MLKKLKKELDELYVVRERALILQREIIAVCRGAIRDVQKERFVDAEKKSVEVKKKIAECRKILAGFPGLADDILGPAYQEYAELEIYRTYSKSKKLPELDMPAKYYLPGLGDAIGELKRTGMEMLARGEIKDAEKICDELEDLYSEFSQYVYPNSLVPGLKPKQDVARKILADFHNLIQNYKSMRH